MSVTQILPIACAVLAFGIAPSFAAVNEPRLVSSFPAIDGFARSDVATSITATYDQDLFSEYTTFELFTNASVAVPGFSGLTGDVSGTGGRRTVRFIPDSPLNEAASPYMAKVRAWPLFPGEPNYRTWNFGIDDTAPLAPAITDPLNGQVRTDQPVSIRGTGEVGAIIHIVEDNQPIAFDFVNNAGQFSVTLPYPYEDGVMHTVAARPTDRAGNMGPVSPSVTFLHDSISIMPTITFPTENLSLNTTAVTVTGTAKANTSITITESATTIATTTADGDGNWSVPITFASGAHSITATSFDGVFTDGPSTARAFTIDVGAPGAPTITSPTAGAQLNSALVTVTGTSEPNVSVRVREAGILRATVPSSGAGAWTASLSFTEGAHTITAAALDAAGNVGPASSRTFTVDTVAPAAPVIDTPAQDSFVNTNPVAVSGDAEPGSTVQVLAGTVVVGSTTAGVGGAWSVAISFTDAAHSIRAVAIDAASNVSPLSALRSFTVDTVAPGAPTFTAPAPAATLSTAIVTVSGLADGSTTVTVKEGVTTVGTAVAAPNGVWSTEITFANGSHTLTARATDLAGNIGPLSAPLTFTVSASGDAIPPPAPAIIDPSAASIQRGFVVFRGTGEVGATIRVYEGLTVRGSATADGSGTWTFGLTMTSGSHTVTAKATDPAGNVGPASAPRSFAVDAQIPTVSFATTSGTIFLTANPIVLDGGAADNLGVVRVEVEYYGTTGEHVLTATAGSCVGCPGTPVTWEATPTLPVGSYTAKAFAVDLAGNRSAPATLRFYRL